MFLCFMKKLHHLFSEHYLKLKLKLIVFRIYTFSGCLFYKKIKIVLTILLAAVFSRRSKVLGGKRGAGKFSLGGVPILKD